MIVAQLYDYTQTQQIVHVKWVNCMIWELYHNKAVIFFQMRGGGRNRSGWIYWG